jgi:NAD(P)-dependent dehydrogenase (short-subunit alcohol dehydrogenase family)
VRGPFVKVESGRIAVVTGAASGIGLALAKKAASSGMVLILTDVDGDRLGAAAGSLRAGGATVEALPLDISDPQSTLALAEAAFGRGSVQLLCSNAGILVRGRVWELPLQDWERVMGVNLWPTIHLLRSFLPRLIDEGLPAHVLITGSMASVTSRPGIGPYTTAKHGLLAVAETTWRELREVGAAIGVTILMPGQVATGMVPGTPGVNGLLDPDAVAATAFEAVAADRLFAFTHADRMVDVRTRFSEILEGEPNR